MIIFETFFDIETNELFEFNVAADLAQSKCKVTFKFRDHEFVLNNGTIDEAYKEVFKPLITIDNVRQNLKEFIKYKNSTATASLEHIFYTETDEIVLIYDYTSRDYVEVCTSFFTPFSIKLERSKFYAFVKAVEYALFACCTSEDTTEAEDAN